ncbi:MAG TPA: tRNA (adenosine(37)-N6)-threonylcarbamoyltransferase complex dimerization subunit type 1 TsaB [Granulicella sp.]|jgi:tRNA threonylcarbamoyladenosine biosynthesis protein TsaB|nr:tRNA (adenosine(37)-N6)-threonylcarbamoyltransferase complex dimerization subunit type 1 TsaB [Granulicella sp.]
MKVLLLHTCGAEASAALADTGLVAAIVAEARMPGRTASERLVAAVRELMEGAGWALAELGAIAVVSGPGSFTGVRVGLSAAKGLSEASGVPLVAVSRLALVVGVAQSHTGDVCAVLDAGRGEFYCGRYVGGDCVTESLVGLEEALRLAGKAGVAVACEAKVAEALSLELVEEPSAADALPIVLERLRLGLFEDAETMDANYLRRTDAEIFAKPGGGEERQWPVVRCVQVDGENEQRQER